MLRYNPRVDRSIKAAIDPPTGRRPGDPGYSRLPRTLIRTHDAVPDVGLIAGIRNAEQGRDKRERFNVADGTVRLEARQTKPGKARVADLPPNLIACLKWAEAQWQRDLAYDQRSFTLVRITAGFEEWPVNFIRHTGLSFMLKRLGSFADTAMARGQLGEDVAGALCWQGVGGGHETDFSAVAVTAADSEDAGTPRRG